MTSKMELSLNELSPTQQNAVDWGEGAALVLAGPGAGKTRVLTMRVARILESSPNRNFRILALTFTTKAADEMRRRIEVIVPDSVHRTVIGTFHSFCARLLRQHGSHLGIKPSFGIYDQDEDREELLRDALELAASRGEPVTVDDTRWLKVIDQLRRSLINPDETARHFHKPEIGERVKRVYAIYEKALRDLNVMDFNGMILETCRLVRRMPAVASLIQKSYPYWMIDEFQDTTPSQYRLLRMLAGDAFNNIFVVADDDQIIYQWAGASYQQIADFRRRFEPELIQLVENHRCPPQIVQAANNLIAHNIQRTPGKEILIATRPCAGPAITCHEFPTDGAETQTVAQTITDLGDGVWGDTAILGRTRAILKPIKEALQELGVPASVTTRRDRFVSPQWLWLHSCLDLSVRPTNRRMCTTLTSAANRIAGLELDAAILIAEARSQDASFLETWALATENADGEIASRLSEYALRLVNSRTTWRDVMTEALCWLPTTVEAPDGIVSDIEEDKAAWDTAVLEIQREKGGQPDLDEILRGIALRPKEPPRNPKAVRLMTIHAAKGLEFDYVWVVGVAEEIIPSWQSLKEGAMPAELEEERRNMFVAITRTGKELVLSYANRYRGIPRRPSRFLDEMRLDSPVPKMAPSLGSTASVPIPAFAGPQALPDARK